MEFLIRVIREIRGSNPSGRTTDSTDNADGKQFLMHFTAEVPSGLGMLKVMSFSLLRLANARGVMYV